MKIRSKLAEIRNVMRDGLTGRISQNQRDNCYKSSQNRRLKALKVTELRDVG